MLRDWYLVTCSGCGLVIDTQREQYRAVTEVKGETKYYHRATCVKVSDLEYKLLQREYAARQVH